MILGILGKILGRFWALLGFLEMLLGHSGVLLGRSWVLLDILGVLLGISVRFGTLWGALGRFFYVFRRFCMTCCRFSIQNCYEKVRNDLYLCMLLTLHALNERERTRTNENERERTRTNENE